MKFFEGLEWAMGFQWPVIAVFLILLVIGIGRLIAMGAQEPSRNITPADVKKKRAGWAGAAGKPKVMRHPTIRVNAGPRPVRRMRQTPQRRMNRVMTRLK
jgi:hypothetical protein